MKGRRTIALGAIITLFAAALIPQAAMAGPKRRIAVLPFEYGAVSGSLGGYDLGKGVASLLITKLVNDGTYSIIDRQHLDAILKEQNFSVSDRADASTANKIGKMLGVDAVVYGTITAFGFEDKRTSYSAPSVPIPVSIPYVGGVGSLFGGFHGSSRKQKAKTAIDATVTDTNTGEILAAVHGAGESAKASSSFGAYDVDSSDFGTSLAGEATNQAVEQMGGQLIAMAAKIPDNQSLALQNVEGRVADVTGREVIVNVGKQNGIAAGDHLSVDRPFKTIKDPVTGKVLKEMSSTIALIKIREVAQDNATGDITKGSGVKVGDSVKKVTTDVTAVIITPLPDHSGGSGISVQPKTTMTTSGTVLKKETTK
ncbi:MAG: curli production assembly protein CsgG [Candidatus Melainabacteria bacterium]|jgi:curli biogenesis system outer membrane secretion channel CsgG|nr:curli production assembly protein CsgG [Candidatus Melainabacteria bacterium]